MFLENKKSEVLRELVARSGDRARIDRLQVMVVCLGERLGVFEEELVAWRTVVVAGEVGESLSIEEIEASGFDESWLFLSEAGVFSQCCLVADAWNRGCEAEESDLKDWVLGQVGDLIESRVGDAFGYAVEVILPLRI